MSGSWLLWAGAVAIFVALLVLLLNVATGRAENRVAMSERLGGLGTPAREEGGGLSGMWGSVSEFAGRQVAARGRERALATRLENAGLAILPGDYVAAAGGVAALAAVLGFVLAGLLGAVVLAAVALFVAHSWLSRKIDKRRSAFDDQLPASLQLIAGSLRAGYGLLQACDSVSEEMEAPISEEFQRLVRETRMGRSVYDALESMRSRVANDDFAWVVEAIEIHRDVGGDLAELVDNVGETIRARNRVRRRVRTLSAEGRLSAIILFILPLAMVGVLRVVSPEYFDELTGTGLGQVMIFVGIVLLIVGGIWLRRLVRVQF